MERNKIVIDNSNNKSGKVKKFFYNLFVKNIGYKAVAFAIAVVLWILMAGLNF